MFCKVSIIATLSLSLKRHYIIVQIVSPLLSITISDWLFISNPFRSLVCYNIYQLNNVQTERLREYLLSISVASNMRRLFSANIRKQFTLMHITFMLIHFLQEPGYLPSHNKGFHYNSP